MTRTLRFFLICALAAASLTGCTRSVKYGDATARRTITSDFDRADLQMIAQKMVDSLLSSAALGNQRPLLYVARVKNKTNEQIDTQNITDSIRAGLLRSGSVRFTAAMEMGDELVQQLQYQLESGLVRPDTAKQIGQQTGADYFLYGTITSIPAKAGRTKEVYFKFTMQMVDIQTAEINWADEMEIVKIAKRRLLGL